jgi:AcrR family transcriptional regulator
MSRKTVRNSTAPVRDRLLKAADRLFYKEGIGAVGIDRVLEEADAAKASLYAHFGCKDDLIAAYVQGRIEYSRQLMEQFMEAVPPADRALRVFDFVEAWTNQSDFRGCPVQHAVAELTDATHPARLLAAEQRQWLLARFTEWARDAGVANPKRIAGALLTLFDGAVAGAEQDGPARARDAKWAAAQLLTRRSDEK